MFKKGDVVLIPFPFTDLTSAKTKILIVYLRKAVTHDILRNSKIYIKNRLL